MQKRQVKEFMGVRDHHSQSLSSHGARAAQIKEKQKKKTYKDLVLTKPHHPTGIRRPRRTLLRLVRRRLHLQGPLLARKRLPQPLRPQVDGYPAARERSLPGAQCTAQPVDAGQIKTVLSAQRNQTSRPILELASETQSIFTELLSLSLSTKQTKIQKCGR